MSNWTTADIPTQRGRTAIVTGTGGLGFESALALARAGAEVIIAGRSAAKGSSAVDQIRERAPEARVRFELLDLAALDSIARFVGRLEASRSSVDLLINNAGVMTPPVRQLTANGFELQLGTNYLGHFALTGRLLPLLRKGRRPRVVTVSSIAARSGSICLEDLQSESRYKPMVAYSQSKLACLMFAFELQRRSHAGGWGIESMAAHPGISRTDLLPNGAGKWSGPGMMRRYLWFLFQPAALGALPSLYAATSPLAVGGRYYGPNGMAELRGYPTTAKTPVQALDAEKAAQLWRASAQLVRMPWGE